MTTHEQDAPAPSDRRRIRVIRVITVLLGALFLVAFLFYLATTLVTDMLLDPQLYTEAFEENDIYNRIYTDLLADPALEETTAALLGNTKLEGQEAGIVSMATSTLYLILPPATIQSAVEGLIVELTSYVKGETDRLEARLDLSSQLDQEALEARIIDALVTTQAQQIAESAVAVQEGESEPDLETLAAYSGALSQGRLGDVPATALASRLDQLSETERREVADALLDPVAHEVSPLARLQVEAALAADDLPSALAIASRVLLQERVSEAAVQLLDDFENSGTLDAVVGAAIYLEETEESVIAGVNAIRDLVAFLDRRLIPLTVLVMAISMALIVWLQGKGIAEALRSAGATLIVSGGLALALWFLLGLVLRAWLPALFDGSHAAIPASLESMVRDVVASLATALSSSVWSSALVVAVGGGLLVALSYLPNITALFQRALGPIWPHRKAVLTGLAVLIVVVPALSRTLRDALREEELPCNGHVELCDRPFNEVAFAATHNSMSIADYLWVWPSHDGTVTYQLNSGIRAFLIDTHYWDAAASISSYLSAAPPFMQTAVDQVLARAPYEILEGTYVCHLICQLGSTPLSETLDEIRDFLESHPGEVVALIIEDKITAEDTAKAFESAGLLPYAYAHPPGEPWPTLGELIERGERLVVMAEVEGPPPDWYHHVWDYTEETPYSVASEDEFDCEPNRGGTGQPLFLLNHWIERVSPSRVDAVWVNEYEFLLSRARRCADERGQIPNFVAVNFHLAGDVVRVVDALNGVRDADQR